MTDEKNCNFLAPAISIQAVFLLLIAGRLSGVSVPVITEIVGIVYLSFLPGVLILTILKLNRFGISLTICYAVGISLIFNMMLGFIINVTFAFAGINTPLSTISLLITWSIVVALLTYLAYRQRECFPALQTFRITELCSPHVLFFILLPVLAVLGALIVTHFQYNIVLFILLAAIAIIMVLISTTKIIPERYYNLAIYCIALSLLWHFSNVSEYLVQWDSFLEYHFFNLSDSAAFWDWTKPENYNAMLSITVLPTLFSQLIGMSGDFIFKVVYPLWYALVPVVLYSIYQHRTDKKSSFLAVFFFISIYVFFLEMPSINRQMIAELFIVLLISLILNEVITGSKKVLLILFGIGIIVSHYSLTYIYMGFLIIAIVMIYWFRRKTSYITATFVVLFAVVSIAWYIYVSSAQPLESVVVIGKHIATSVSTDLLNPTSRDLSSIFMQSAADSLHLTYRILWYFILACIALGGIPVLPEIVRKRSGNPEYTALIVGSYILLAACIVIPFFSVSLGINRMIHIASIILAPLGITGLKIVFNSIRRVFRRDAYNLYNLNAVSMTGITIILAIFFLFNCRLIYELADSPADRSIPLAYGDVINNNPQMPLRDRVTIRAAAPTAAEVNSAEWLKKYRNKDMRVYATPFQIDMPVLVSYGMLNPDEALIITPETTNDELMDSYMYLGYINTVMGYGTTKAYTGRPDPILGNTLYWDINEIKPVTDNLNSIYSNGESKILWSP